MRKYILCWSGGKDSTASAVLIKENHLFPVEDVEILMSEVMFDDDFTGENPMHMEWVRATAIPRLESWGFKVTIVRSEKSYLDLFSHIITKATIHSEHNGMMYGFPVFGRCAVKRDLKIRPLEKYKRENYPDGYQEIIGICADEPKRLKSMHKNPNAVSVLEMLGYTESMCLDLCRNYGLLSPIYTAGLTLRSGCHFCPNAKKEEMRYMRLNHPDIWNKLLFLENTAQSGRVAFSKWNPFRETLAEIDETL